MSYARIVFNTGLDATQLAARLRLSGQTIDGPEDLQKLAAVIAANNGGRGTHLRFVKNAVRATQTGTFTGLPTAADTVTINGVAFTARASGAVANEYNIGADATACAAALAAAINASTSAKIKNIILAESALGVVTLTCLVPGSIGNLCTLTESSANFTVAGANLASGSEDTEVLINAGRAA